MGGWCFFPVVVDGVGMVSYVEIDGQVLLG